MKEYVQALVDDGKLRVEKIGSGNWYWCFPADEVNEKTRVLDGLKAEHEKLERNTTDLEEKVEEVKKGREDHGDGGRGRDELMERLRELEMQVSALKKEEQGFLDAGVGGVERIKGEIEIWKKEAEMWTDGLHILEQYLERMTGGDRETILAVKKSVYESEPGEWSEEGGLREME